jgi:hypothetical protein
MTPALTPLQRRRSWLGLLAGLALLAGTPAHSQTTAPVVHTFRPFVAVTSLPSANTEAVSFQGLATVRSRLAHDTETRQPNLLLELVWDGIKGDGRSGSKFVMRGGELLVLPVLAQQSVEVDIPVAPQDGRDGPPRTGRVTLQLYFNTATGALMSASLGPLQLL